MKTEPYNGWTNYETWCVNLWIYNDEISSDYWREQARAAKDTNALSHVLKDSFEADASTALHSQWGVFADLLNAALSEVNWYEIAEHLMEDIDSEKEEDTCKM